MRTNRFLLETHRHNLSDGLLTIRLLVLGFEEIANHLMAALGQHAFRMELYAFDR